ncbi:hypothetical protein LCGC14_1225870 [marine sediment metagenome]|uniref:Uncharacterized protein n=1 Tax=marine sediment metagenome TaxID=412755 RepID=A0A0F9LA18_9ZZZZ
MKTQEQIDEQIRLLKEARDKIVPTSMFGTDNIELLDAQVRVLEKDMDEDDIYDRWDRDEEDMDVRSSAGEALKWMDDDEECMNENLVDGFPMQEQYKR